MSRHKPKAVSPEGAAAFREACNRLGIDHRNCFEKLGFRKSMFYDYGNGDYPVNETVWKLLDSMQAYQKLEATLRELENELRIVRKEWD